MNKKNLINFWLNYYKNLIIINPARFTALLFSIIMILISLCIPENTYFYTVQRHIVDGEKHYYEVEGISNALEYNSEQTLFKSGGDILIKSTIWNQGSVILFSISITIFVIFIFSLCLEELELKNVIKKTIHDNIKVINTEDGRYIYTSYNKLLVKKTYQTKISIEMDSVKDFFSLNNFYTKSEIRDNKLEQLGI